MHGFFDFYPVENPIDRLERDRRAFRTSGNVGFVHLNAGTGQLGDLRGHDVGDGHRERFEVPVMIVEQRAGEHVGAGQRELEIAARDGS